MSSNVGIAFALVILAGGAMGLGAAVVFFPRLVKLASRRTLAGALGLSAGVMTYVSFVAIFQKPLLVPDKNPTSRPSLPLSASLVVSSLGWCCCQTCLHAVGQQFVSHLEQTVGVNQ